MSAGGAPRTVSRTFEAAGVPGVLAAPAGIDHDAPLLILWHGFGPPPEAEGLAERLPLHGLQAYRAYLDLPLFGRRRPEGGPRELGERQAEDYLQRLLWPAVERATAEITDVVAALGEQLDAGFGRGLGLFGHSAGGLVALHVLAEGVLPVRAAATFGAPASPETPLNEIEELVGEPYEWTPDAREKADRLDIAGRADDIAAREPKPHVLLLHGGEDDRVPPSDARHVCRALRRACRETPGEAEVRAEILDGHGHSIGPESGGGGEPDSELGTRLLAWYRERLADRT